MRSQREPLQSLHGVVCLHKLACRMPAKQSSTCVPCLPLSLPPHSASSLDILNINLHSVPQYYSSRTKHAAKHRTAASWDCRLTDLDNMPATRFDETSIWRRIRYTESYGHDNAADVPGAESSSASPSTSHQSQAADILTQSCHESHAEPKQDPITSPDNGPTGSARDIPSADDARHECHNSVVPHSHSNSGVGTHAYFQALNNRFVFDRFDPGGDLDPEVYTPVFLHDTLMLPGSLAQLIGKVLIPSLAVRSASSLLSLTRAPVEPIRHHPQTHSRSRARL